MDLKTYRKNARLTQLQLSTMCGCDRSMIGKIENGDALPSVNLAKAIGKALGFDWTLFYEDESKGA